MLAINMEDVKSALTLCAPYTVNSTVTYGENNKRSTDLIAAVNQFPYVGGM